MIDSRFRRSCCSIAILSQSTCPAASAFTAAALHLGIKTPLS
ncbi:MAG TPA: hypothetical protein VMQ76_03555 [Terracidiphilus sp.]|nr:hypothetical protein [Terracidiphilus sp.]